jgi:glucosamine-6-phosphate deaminase
LKKIKIGIRCLYVPRDLVNPHGTNKVCLGAIFEVEKELKSKDCHVWLYRSAWQKWGINEIKIAIHTNPNQVLSQSYGTFKHQSQKDGVVFQGSHTREFWQRAEYRNGGTALL